jgi:diketogulonate reductase-like aldo/keto reductase
MRCRHVDTAALYRNERDVGRAVRDSGVPREDVFVTTKLWPGTGGGGYEATKAAFQASLDLLDIGYIDLYLIHAPTSPATRLEDWRAMEDITSDGSGRLRSIGVSNYGVHHLEELAKAARIQPVCNQIELHPFLPRHGIVSYCDAHGIAVVAYSPLAKGTRMTDPRLAAIASKYPGATVAKVRSASL